jgi:glucuronosyltransferase
MYLDEAQNGVIYFSMGSVLQGSEMPDSVRNAFVDAFSKLKQRVLWKWERDSLPGQPSNVKVGKWLPQSDILGELLQRSLYFTCNRIRILNPWITLTAL